MFGALDTNPGSGGGVFLRKSSISLVFVVLLLKGSRGSTLFFVTLFPETAGPGCALKCDNPVLYLGPLPYVSEPCGIFTWMGMCPLLELFVALGLPLKSELPKVLRATLRPADALWLWDRVNLAIKLGAEDFFLGSGGTDG